MSKTISFALRVAFIPLALMGTVATFNSCHKRSTGIQVERIQYDVPLVSDNPDADWWVQNVEGRTREQWIQGLLASVVDGKTKAWDVITFHELPLADVQSIIRQVDSISMPGAKPPYNLVDTVIVKEIRLSDIKKMRFLEEWQIDPATQKVNKQVMGICPMAQKLDASGNLLGYRPLFWLFFDKRYPSILKGTN